MNQKEFIEKKIEEFDKYFEVKKNAYVIDIDDFQTDLTRTIIELTDLIEKETKCRMNGYKLYIKDKNNDWIYMTEENLKRHALFMKIANGSVDKKDITDAIELADNEIKEWKKFKKYCESL